MAEALERLASRTEGEERGVRLEKVAGGWRFVTRPEFDSLLRKFHEVTERSRLVARGARDARDHRVPSADHLPEIQDIRGVNSSSVLKTLFEKKLITTAGKKPVVGTPFFYRTTQDFLVRFGLNELTELPKPEDLDADLAATVEAREIAAPTAAAPSIRIESGEAVSRAEEDMPTRTTKSEDEDDEDDDEDEEDEGRRRGRAPKPNPGNRRSRKSPRAETDPGRDSDPEDHRLCRLSLRGAQAEEWIREGRVRVNGRVAKLGERADPEKDSIKVDDKRVHTTTGARRPTSCSTSPRASSRRCRTPKAATRCSTCFRHGSATGVKPVGRLDVMTEGLLLLTDDGELARIVTHPSSGCEKEYWSRSPASRPNPSWGGFAAAGCRSRDVRCVRAGSSASRGRPGRPRAEKSRAEKKKWTRRATPGSA